MRTITVDATALDKGADYLNRYADKLDERSAAVLDALLMRCAEEAANNLGHVDTGETLSSIRTERHGIDGTVSAGGNAVWLEFGTGTALNGAGYNHPKAKELGMSAHGTYIWPLQKSSPPRPHGGDGGWWFPGDDGHYYHTMGFKATFFFYNAAQYIRKMYARIAKGAYK